MYNSFENVYSHVYFKLFHTFDRSTVAHCQYYMGQLPIELKIVMRKLKFFQQIKRSQNCTLKALSLNDNEINSITCKYGMGKESWKLSMWKYFETNLDLS